MLTTFYGLVSTWEAIDFKLKPKKKVPVMLWLPHWWTCIGQADDKQRWRCRTPGTNIIKRIKYGYGGHNLNTCFEIANFCCCLTWLCFHFQDTVIFNLPNWHLMLVSNPMGNWNEWMNRAKKMKVLLMWQ